MNTLLTDEEMDGLDYTYSSEIMLTSREFDRHVRRVIAQAQDLKTKREMVERLKGDIVASNYHSPEAGCKVVSIAVEDWESLKKEVGS